MKHSLLVTDLATDLKVPAFGFLAAIVIVVIAFLFMRMIPSI
jgi:hypothetical protein